MAKLCPLASSSAGNSTYIGTQTGGILVDAGISCRKITAALAQLGTAAAALRGILITHEHTDHIKGLKTLTKQHTIPLYATAGVLEYLCRNDLIAPETPLHPVTRTSFAVDGIEVQAFATPHDACDSVGYRLTAENGQRMAIATDLGNVTAEVRAGVLGCDAVLLEANYDATLLRMGRYPYFLKERIASATGHLENIDTAAFAQELVASGTSHLILGHLSKENNNPALAEQTVATALAAAGAQRNCDFTLQVAQYDQCSPPLRF